MNACGKNPMCGGDFEKEKFDRAAGDVCEDFTKQKKSWHGTTH